MKLENWILFVIGGGVLLYFTNRPSASGAVSQTGGFPDTADITWGYQTNPLSGAYSPSACPPGQYLGTSIVGTPACVATGSIS